MPFLDEKEELGQVLPAAADLWLGAKQSNHRLKPTTYLSEYCRSVVFGQCFKIGKFAEYQVLT